MQYVIRIKMQPGCENSNYPEEIDSLYIDGRGLVSKGILYDEIKRNSVSIKVGIAPYPDVVPAVSSKGEKYVKSTPNQYGHDNLLSLPRI